MGRYIDILLFCFYRSLIRDLSFKINFFIRFFIDSVFLIVYIAFFLVLFTKVNTIAGWKKYEVIMLIGIFHIINSIFLSVVFPNLARLPLLIKNGQLDSYLLKPIDSQFLVSINIIETGALSNIFLGLALVIKSIMVLQLTISFVKICIFVFSIIAGVLIIYCVFKIFLITSFWLDDASWCIPLYMSLSGFIDKPIDIYKGVIGRMMIYLIPLALVANVPSKIMFNLDNNAKELFIITILILGLLFNITRYLWRKSLVRYEGASI